MWIYFLLSLVLMGSVYAPFPVGHTLNRLNPFIEPWWNNLQPETQDHVYGAFEPYEPLSKAAFDWIDSKARKKTAKQELFEAGKDLLAAKIQELKAALVGEEWIPSYADLYGDSASSSPYHNYKDMETELRYQSEVDLQWERFQAAFQHALFLKLAEKRQFYQKMLAKFRAKGAFKAGVQTKLEEAKEEFDEKYREKLEKLKEKIWELKEKKHEKEEKIVEGLLELKEKKQEKEDQILAKLLHKEEEEEEHVATPHFSGPSH